MVATLARSGTNSFALNNQRAHDAWGNIRQGATTSDPKYRYCVRLGHQQDDESGLVYMRARYFEAASGRFISEDPDMSGFNYFSYCSDNPIRFVDDTGKAIRDWNLYLVGIGITFFLAAGAVARKWPGQMIDGAVMALLSVAILGFSLALGETNFGQSVGGTRAIFAAGLGTCLAGVVVGLVLGETVGGIGGASTVAAALYDCVLIAALMGCS